MRAVLFDATPPGSDACRQGADALRRALSDAGHAVDVFPLAELPMAPCRGCFACWTATPGRCPVSDASEIAARAYIASELAVFFSPLSFGVWNSTTKKLLDRMICLVSPFFDTTHASGLTRHKPRYSRYPAFLGVGWLAASDSEAQGLFARLVERNAFNLRAPAWEQLTLTRDRPWSAQREACLEALDSLLEPAS
ncbi:MAG: hypothetical protein ACLGSA_10785 [Acidobacteriota bacterium]